MNNELRDVLTAASRAPSQRSANDPQLAAVPPAQPVPASAPAPRKAEVVALIDGPAVRAQAAPAARPSAVQAQAPQTELVAMRLGFWLCGFHEALQERKEAGQTLTEREASLLELSRREFVDMRPLVIGMAVHRLDAVLAAEADKGGKPERDTMEGFAHATLRDLSARAAALLEAEGPDAAFALLGGDAGTIEPLAIFQAVFTTALSLAESFAAVAGGKCGSLLRTAHALETEIEKV